jgi:hypothetical protein
MNNRKYIASIMSPRFTGWWVRNNGLNPNHFSYDAEQLRKRFEQMENGYWLIPYSFFLCVCGWASLEVGSHSVQPFVFFVLSAVLLILGLFLFIRNKLFFRNHLLLELAYAWKGALSDFMSVPAFKNGVSSDNTFNTIKFLINEQLLDWGVESLKLKAIGETNSKRCRTLLQKIDRLVALSKKCRIGSYEVDEVWRHAKFQLDNPKQNPELK